MNKLIIDFNDIYKKSLDNLVFFDLNFWINKIDLKVKLDEVTLIIDTNNKFYSNYLSGLEELKDNDFQY